MITLVVIVAGVVAGLGIVLAYWLGYAAERDARAHRNERDETDEAGA